MHKHLFMRNIIDDAIREQIMYCGKEATINRYKVQIENIRQVKTSMLKNVQGRISVLEDTEAFLEKIVDSIENDL